MALHLDLKRKSVSVCLDERIYGAEAISLAVRAYSEFCEINVSRKNGRATVIIFPQSNAIALETLGLEFSNYALAKSRELA